MNTNFRNQYPAAPPINLGDSLRSHQYPTPPQGVNLDALRYFGDNYPPNPRWTNYVSVDPMISELVNEGAQHWGKIIDEQPSILRGKFSFERPPAARDFEEFFRVGGVNRLDIHRPGMDSSQDMANRAGLDNLFSEGYLGIFRDTMLFMPVNSDNHPVNLLASVGSFELTRNGVPTPHRMFVYEQYQDMEYTNDPRGSRPQLRDLFFVPEDQVAAFGRDVGLYPDLMEALFRRRYSVLHRGPSSNETGTHIRTTTLDHEIRRTQASEVIIFSMEQALADVKATGRATDKGKVRSMIADWIKSRRPVRYTHPVGEIPR